MKIAVMNMVGHIGKSTIAANMLMPRLKNPKFFSIETINSGAEMDGIEVEKIRGKNFRELTDEIMRIDDAIVDIGATNFEDFSKLMQQYSGSHEEFDYFVVPVVNDEKCFEDTVKTILKLKALGVERKRVRILFNKVDFEDDIERDFAAIFGLCASEKFGVVNKDAVVYKNEIFDMIKSLGKPLGSISTDETDYRAKLRAAKTEEEKDAAIAMIQVKRLAISANKNLDDAFAALFK